MVYISLDEIQRDFQQFSQLLQAGETFLVTEGSRPVAEIKPLKKPSHKLQPRPFGLCAGEFTVPDDFDEPLPEEILTLFES